MAEEKKNQQEIEKREVQNKRTRRAYLELLILEDYEAAARFVKKHGRLCSERAQRNA